MQYKTSSMFIRLSADYSDEACRAFVERLVDDKRVNVRIINKALWTMAALIADTWRVGRIFLAGDAAHRLPPTGGLGMNTGIQDAHNLAWKLAMVLKNEAESTLLDTYMTERLPVCRTNIAWSTRNSQRMTTIFEALFAKDYKTMAHALDEQQEHLNQLALDIGFCYTEGCVLPEPGLHAPSEGDNYRPSTVPGVRAPHCWLTRAHETCSTLDLFEKTFVLLCTDAAQEWPKAAAALEGAPIVCYRIGKNGELQDKDGNWQSLYQIGERGAVLVRPDGHVAWRSVDGVTDAKQTLKAVWKALSGRADGGRAARA
ncbi:FAD dependent oxidoreductase [Legionella geestiana]|uniref:FAD dependent oxidoreductase n=2 Tax=Legionella geestiana TaxID=45065 RepID=A0A0W0TRS0_9GAMM|nr:FAD-dependent monooxygenase [Legionella geestiana]KTC98317.1 FAD dependent oxidoreductase [Legionella geestiana]QBS11964.1 hypothetical protein E4T54_03915 [Legionella geestiana]STX53323.1 FAD dependent oxidoreductase [Legionella geestiana]